MLSYSGSRCMSTSTLCFSQDRVSERQGHIRLHGYALDRYPAQIHLPGARARRTYRSLTTISMPVPPSTRGYSTVRVCARRPRRSLDDDVELDDGDFSADTEGFGIGPILGQAWSAASGITDRLTDVVYDYVPDDVSRSTVNLAVKAGLLLILIGFTRSILGFLLTVGTIVLGLFVASRVLGTEAGEGGPRSRGKKGSGGWGSGGSRNQRRSPPRPARRLPSGVAKDSDVLDVWFEKREAETERRRKGR